MHSKHLYENKQRNFPQICTPNNRKTRNLARLRVTFPGCQGPLTSARNCISFAKRAFCRGGLHAVMSCGSSTRRM